MYSIINKPNRLLIEYLSQPHIEAVQFDNGRKCFTIDGQTKKGLLKTLKSIYYPTYVRKRKQYKRKGIKVKRKASNKTEGKAVDRQLVEYVRSKKKPRHAKARALIAYWEDECKHTIQAAQVPTIINDFNGVRVTAADVITEDSEKRLWVWEVKCGYNQVQRQGSLKRLKDVPNKDHSHWELQRWFTHKGLVTGGLPVFASHVINVYNEGDCITVKKRKVPTWALKQLK